MSKIHRDKHSKSYTVISNSLIFDDRLSANASYLLTAILSLSDNWKFNKEGLKTKLKTKLGRTAFDTAFKQLKDCGYIQLQETRNSKGQKCYDWQIYECPQTGKPSLDKPVTADEQLISNNKTNTNEKIIRININQSYENLVKQNIEYDFLIKKYNQDEIDGILDIILSVCNSKKHKTIVRGEEYLTSIVKSELLKLNSQHIEYVIECVHNNTTEIKNPRAYLLTSLFNARTTIDQYYHNQMRKDFYG